jgi:hypothetical protein
MQSIRFTTHVDLHRKACTVCHSPPKGTAARAVVLLMRLVAAPVAYANSSRSTFARSMAGRTACAAQSIRTLAALLAMPRLRTQRTKARAVFLVGSMRVRSAVNSVSLARCSYITMQFILRFVLYAAALLEPPLPDLLLCPFGFIAPFISCTCAQGMQSSERSVRHLV